MYRAADGGFIAPPNGIRDHHIGSQRDADKQIYNQPDHRAVGAHRRDRCGALGTGEVADHSNIRCVE